MTTLSDISILVVKENDEPAENAEVTIWWENGGFSEKRTGQSGQALFENLGEVGRITVDNKTALPGPVNYNTDVSLRLRKT